MLTVTLTPKGVILRQGDIEIVVEPGTLKEANFAAAGLRQASKHIQTIEFEGASNRYSPGGRDRRHPHAPRDDLRDTNGNR